MAPPHADIVMSQEKTLTRTRKKLKYPRRYDVVIHNDDYTPMDFVVTLLIEKFGKNIADAKSITLQVHTNGSAVAGTYFYEIAEQKCAECVASARNQGHPLQVTMEPIE